MPFRLKNSGGHIPKVGEPHVLSLDRKKCGSVHIDDILVKRNDKADHLDELKETFDVLRK